MNTYTFDVYTAATVHVKAESEQEARELLNSPEAQEMEAPDYTYLRLDGEHPETVEISTLAFRKVWALVYATDPDGRDVPVSELGSDGPVPVLEEE